MAGGADSVKTIFYALGANFAIFVAKSVAAVMTGSGAMLAEAVHSLADCGNQVLLLLGVKRSKLPPTPEYPLGRGKEVYFWSFLVAVLLFTVGGAYSLYEGMHKLSHPEALRSPWIAVSVLVFGLIAEGVSMRTCIKEVNKVRGGRSYWQWFRESRKAELVVIFGEDLAALLGLAFALVAVVATMVTGNPIFDAIGTLGIGVLLIVIAVFVAIEVKALLIGQSIDADERVQIRELIAAQPEIAEVFNVITLQLGEDELLAVKARVHECHSTQATVEAINRVEKVVRAAFPSVRWCFFEPDDHN
ncbi:MAG: cation diffusion facilitator family transporter [Xanthomonadales bacterium]|nr:cation diffusion facilitator family transporter [Xanthomonadales bacterium]